MNAICQIFSLKTIIKFMFTSNERLLLWTVVQQLLQTKTRERLKPKLYSPINLHCNCKHWLSDVAQEGEFVQPTNPQWAANGTHCSLLHRQAAGHSGLGTAMSLLWRSFTTAVYFPLRCFKLRCFIFCSESNSAICGFYINAFKLIISFSSTNF